LNKKKLKLVKAHTTSGSAIQEKELTSHKFWDPWTGRGEPTVWPPCSPDFILMRFCQIKCVSAYQKM